MGSREDLRIETVELEEYFPLRVQNWWAYATDDGSISLQIVDMQNVGGDDCFVMEASFDGESVQKEFYFLDPVGIWLYKRDFGETNFSYEPPYPVLMAPLEQNRSWSWSGKCGYSLVDVSLRVEGEDRVEVPGGAFVSLRISMEQWTPYEQILCTRWFAPGIGMVKEESTFNNMTFRALLEDFSVDS